MIRLFTRRCVSDSPYRYGNRVQVSKHIREKQFGNDVLLFAGPSKLRSEAMSFINDSTQQRPKAFWEILAKRTNESIHLLDFTTLTAVMRAMASCPECEDLLVGVCRVVCEDIESRRDLASRLQLFSDSLVVIETIQTRLGEIPITVMDNFIAFWTDNAHRIESTDDIKRLVRLLEQRPVTQTPSQTDQLLYKKLLHRWNRFSKTESPLAGPVPFSLLLDTVKNS